MSFASLSPAILRSHNALALLPSTASSIDTFLLASLLRSLNAFVGAQGAASHGHGLGRREVRVVRYWSQEGNRGDITVCGSTFRKPGAPEHVSWTFLEDC